MEEGRDEKAVRKNPGQRAGKAGCGKSENRYKHHTHQGSRNHFENSGKDSKAGKAHALDQKTDNVDQSKENIKDRVDD